MIVTGAFLAEAAVAVEGKLHVWGGVLTSLIRPPGSVAVGATLVVLIQAEQGDTQEAIDLEVTAPDGTETTVALPIPEVTRGGTNAGFFYHQVGIHAPADGRYVLVVGSVSIPILVDTHG